MWPETRRREARNEFDFLAAPVARRRRLSGRARGGYLAHRKEKRKMNRETMHRLIAKLKYWILKRISMRVKVNP
jgi:hypothetical protein